MQYGRYQIVSELGRGSMGVVYKAHDPQIARTIVLKVLREDRVTSDDFVRRFQKEAMAVGRLSHPGIVTVFDVGKDHGSIYIAMEYLAGMPLDALMAERKVTLEETVNIGIQTAEALQYAHKHGIIHRDIKPSNIIYTPEGTIRVTDFGIARIEDPNSHQMTQVGEVLGTPRYMSPEQAMGKPLDGRSDLYSLGVILYQLTTGKRPLQGETLVSIFRAIVQDTPEAPHVFDSMVPESLSCLIMKLLDKDPENRFADGQDLIIGLRSCLAVLPQKGKETSSLGGGTLEEKRRSSIWKMAMAGLVGLLLCAIFGGSYLLLRQTWQQTTQQAQFPVAASMISAPEKVRLQSNAAAVGDGDDRQTNQRPTAERDHDDLLDEQKISPEKQAPRQPESQVSAAASPIVDRTVAKDPIRITIAPEENERKVKPAASLAGKNEVDLSQERKVPLAAELVTTVNKSPKPSAIAWNKERSVHAAAKQSVLGKRGSLSAACQSLLKKYELGDGSVIERYRRECGGQ